MIKNPLTKFNFSFVSIIVIHFLFLFSQMEPQQIDIFYDLKNAEDKHKEVVTKIGTFSLNQEDKHWIDSVMSSLPIYEKCAQVFMPVVAGRNLDQSSREFQSSLELVRDHGIGGIIISTGDIEQTAAMINELQKNASIPLLVGADFENGLGMRIKGMNSFPHNMALGATDNPDFAYEEGKAIALEATLLGVNINFAPVADINNNPENPVINLRSFSEDKTTVIDYCLAYAEGSEEYRVIPTAKHFPGHGNTKIDSHKDLPVINGTKEYLLNNEIEPFKELIDDNIPAIMMGHLNVPAFDNDKRLPATLSYNIITKLLKEELKFTGLIITDALDMQAITNYYSDDDAIIKAFQAGNDILLMPPNVKSGITALYKAVQSGVISEARLNESVIKILAAKRWTKSYLHRTKNLNRIADRILIPSHKALADQIAQESITIVKLQKNILPIDLNHYSSPAIINITNRRNNVDSFFVNLFSKFNTSNTFLTARSKEKDYQNTLKQAEKNDLIIIASYFTVRLNDNTEVLDDDQINFIKKVLMLKKDIIFISFENPYVLTLFPNTHNYICTFSNTEASQKSAYEVLFGMTEAKGKLPVSIPNTNFGIGSSWNMNN